MSAPLCIYYRLYDLKKSVQLIVTYPGLIKCGSVVIPFDNQISKDTDLYKLYNTNIHEKIEMMKKQAEN